MARGYEEGECADILKPEHMMNSRNKHLGNNLPEYDQEIITSAKMNKLYYAYFIYSEQEVVVPEWAWKRNGWRLMQSGLR